MSALFQQEDDFEAFFRWSEGWVRGRYSRGMDYIYYTKDNVCIIYNTTFEERIKGGIYQLIVKYKANVPYLENNFKDLFHPTEPEKGLFEIEFGLQYPL